MNIKIFLSHNMTGLDEEDIQNIRENAEVDVYKILLNGNYPEFDSIEFIDNYNHDDAPENASRLWHLGRSIQQLAEADYVYFCDPTANSSGCYVEKFICAIYNIPILK